MPAAASSRVLSSLTNRNDRHKYKWKNLRGKLARVYDGESGI